MSNEMEIHLRCKLIEMEIQSYKENNFVRKD